MAEKKFTLRVIRREARPRSKRLRELGGGAAGAGGGSTVVAVNGGGGGSGASGHTHANKAALDQISTDAAGYLLLALLKEAEAGSGQWTQTVEKVKAGLADLAAALTPDSPTREDFLKRTVADTALERVTFDKGITAKGANYMADLQSPGFIGGLLGAGFRLRHEGGQASLELDRLTVRMKAFFAALEVKQVTYSGGQFIFSAAGAKITRVEDIPGGNAWRCYFTADDGERAVDNLFQPGDLARVQEFNIKPGAHEGVSNTYYWGEVLGIGADYVDIATPATGRCDAGSTKPKAGDDLVQLGNVSEPGRQNAILISAVGDGSPSITQYAGITNDYTLEGKEVTRISPQGNVFTGAFRATVDAGNGESVSLAVQSGGRNYLKDSAGPFFTDPSTPGPAGGVQAVAQLSPDFTSAVAAHAGQSMSLSFDWRTNSASNEADAHRVVGFELTFTLAGGGNDWKHVEAQVPAHTGQLAEGHAQGSFLVPEDATGVSSALLYNRFEGVKWGANLPVAEFSNVSVQWGNTPAAWEPAPEDDGSPTGRLRSELSVQAGQIASVVQEAGKMQSAIKQQADSITLAVEKIESGSRNYFRRDTEIWAYFAPGNNPTALANDTYNAVVEGQPSRDIGFSAGRGAGWMRLVDVIKGNGWWTVSFYTSHNCAAARTLHVDICDGIVKEVAMQPGTTYYVELSGNVQNWTEGGNNFVDIEGMQGPGTFWFQGIQVERGRTATPYAPAPEDGVTEDKLLATGINIRDRKVTLTADQFLFQGNSGQEIAMFGVDGDGNPYLKADYMQAAKRIEAATGTFDAITATSGNSKMSLAGNLIRFTGKSGNSVALGSETLPAETTLGSPLIVNAAPSSDKPSACGAIVETTRPASVPAYQGMRTIGIQASASGGNAWDNSTENLVDCALYLPKGCICGFRLRVRRITGSITCDLMDTVLLCDNTELAYVNLPPEPGDGQLYLIRKCSTGPDTNVIVQGSPYLDRGILRDSTEPVTSVTLTANRMHAFIYSAALDLWVMDEMG